MSNIIIAASSSAVYPVSSPAAIVIAHEGIQGVPGTNGSVILAYKAKTTSTAGDPGPGNILWNNSTQTSATVLFIDHLTNDDIDVDLILVALKTGDDLLLADRDDSANLQQWTITSTPTFFNHANGSYISVPVSLTSSSGTGTTGFANNHSLSLVWRTGGVSDHGALTGLADDDHTQYLNNARGDARYSQLGHGHAASAITNDSATVTGASVANALDSVKGSISGHIADTANPHATTKAQVGLGSVDNTSDVNKPISTATQTALNAKEPTIAAGTTSQYWRGDKSWQTLPSGVTNLSVINSGASTLDIASDTGTDATIPAATSSLAGLMIASDKAKLDKVQALGANIASATTTDIGAATGESLSVTGTTTITSLGTSAAGIKRSVIFAAALILTHNAVSLILPSSANITTAAGDTAEFVSLGSGNWKCLRFDRATGVNLVADATKQAADAGLTSLAGLTGAGVVTASGTDAFAMVSSVPATQGGTGQTTYAVGDLLVGGATNTLTKLADVATGNVLKSGGVGVAPSYGKVSFSTDFAALTASRALASDASGFVSAATTTLAELNFVSGVTSAIQTQINGKQASDAGLTSLAALTGTGYVKATATDTFAQVSAIPATDITGNKSQFNAALTDDDFAFVGTANNFTQPQTVALGVTASTTPQTFSGSINNYFEASNQNTSTGTTASSDFVCTTNTGSATTEFVDLGINGSGWTGSSWGGAKDAYLYASDNHLMVGTNTAGKNLIVSVGAGGANASPTATWTSTGVNLNGANNTVPTAAPGTNSTVIASTAFVTAAVSAGSGGGITAAQAVAYAMIFG